MYLSSDGVELPKSCPDLRMGSIPADHLFHKKTKPVIIGHRGQPLKYQENTLDGFKSVEGMGADGYELDIYKTKDNKLVVFHDDDTLVSRNSIEIYFALFYTCNAIIIENTLFYTNGVIF